MKPNPDRVWSPEQKIARRLARRLAKDLPIDWELEERTAGSAKEREIVAHFRTLAAMNSLHQSMQESALIDPSASVELAKQLLAGPDSPLEPFSLPNGSRWGSLEILEPIGSGTFGEVYRARDPRLEREVALKLLQRNAAATQGEVILEARLLARVQHPNVVVVHGAERVDDRIGIWMELLRGQTLDRILAERGVFDAREAALIGIDICRALAAVHSAGITHRDVKLANVIRAVGGRIVLMDFGLGVETVPPGSGSGSGAEQLSGTPLFMAPEVLQGSRPNACSDIYSLGVVLFALVTGVVPVQAGNLPDLMARHERGSRRQARDLRPDLPATFTQLLQTALSPDPESRFQTAGQLEQALLSALGTVRPTVPGWLRSQEETGPRHLPEESDVFVGREELLETLEQRFQSGTRMVTLLGTAGIGKTRLAVHYGWMSLPTWPGGVWFADLTDATSREGIVSAVASSLGVALGPGDILEQLGSSLASRGRALVILDNFEQVSPHAHDTVEEWMRRSPETRILVTSRERLRLRNEDVVLVEPLPTDSGIELFLSRAQRIRPAILGTDSPETTRELIDLLEGMPLAIELAAARTQVMTVPQLVTRMRERLRVLGVSGKGRHQTLRAAISTSWELLESWEKEAFTQCATFEGGFSLEAAEGVLDLSKWPDAPWIVDVIQALIDKSLLRTWVSEPGSSDPQLRIGMFAVLREYALEQLDPVERNRTEERHGAWFASLGTEESIATLNGREGVQRRRAFARDLENFITACRRAIARGDQDVAALTCRAAWSVLDLQGPYAAGIQLANEVLKLSLSSETRARVLVTLGSAEQRSGLKDASRGHYTDALTLFRETGNRRGEGSAVTQLGTLLLNQGRLDEALPVLEAALEIHREVGERNSEGITRGNLGLLHHERGSLEEASVHLEAALAIHREVGNQRSEAVVLGNLGNLRREQGRLEEARTFFNRALVTHRRVGNRRFEGIVLGNLGTLCVTQDRTEEARQHFIDALAIHGEVGSRTFECSAHSNLGNLAVRRRDWADAHDHYSTALAIGRGLGDLRSQAVASRSLARLYLEQGHFAEARDYIAHGEALLRDQNRPFELAQLHCLRAEIELAAGELDVARAASAEADAAYRSWGEGSDPDLEQRLRSVRDALQE